MEREGIEAVRAAALLLLVAASVSAKDSPMSMTWKKEKNELFSAELPQAWRRKPLSGAEKGYLFTDGLRFISAAKSAEETGTFADRLRAEDPEIEISTSSLIGKPATRLKRVFRARSGGDEVAGPGGWTYEETVLIPAKTGSWKLRLSSTSGSPKPPASAKEAWDRFVRTFKPAAK